MCDKRTKGVAQLQCDAIVEALQALNSREVRVVREIDVMALEAVIDAHYAESIKSFKVILGGLK